MILQDDQRKKFLSQKHGVKKKGDGGNERAGLEKGKIFNAEGAESGKEDLNHGWKRITRIFTEGNRANGREQRTNERNERILLIQRSTVISGIFLSPVSLAFINAD